MGFGTNRLGASRKLQLRLQLAKLRIFALKGRALPLASSAGNVLELEFSLALLYIRMQIGESRCTSIFRDLWNCEALKAISVSFINVDQRPESEVCALGDLINETLKGVLTSLYANGSKTCGIESGDVSLERFEAFVESLAANQRFPHQKPEYLQRCRHKT